MSVITEERFKNLLSVMKWTIDCMRRSGESEDEIRLHVAQWLRAYPEEIAQKFRKELLQEDRRS